MAKRLANVLFYAGMAISGILALPVLSAMHRTQEAGVLAIEFAIFALPFFLGWLAAYILTGKHY